MNDIKQIIFFELSYRELEALVREHIREVDGWRFFNESYTISNNSVYTYEGIGPEDHDLDESTAHPEAVLELLCHRDVIPPGNYLIKVSW